MVNIEPTTGAKVGTWGGSADVETNGTREFTGVPPGEYRITTRPNPGSSDKEYAPPQTVTVKAGQTADVRMLYH